MSLGQKRAKGQLLSKLSERGEASLYAGTEQSRLANVSQSIEHGAPSNPGTSVIACYNLVIL